VDCGTPLWCRENGTKNYQPQEDEDGVDSTMDAPIVKKSRLAM